VRFGGHAPILPDPGAGPPPEYRFVDGWSDRCQPFTWIKPADEILAHAMGKETSWAQH